MAVLAMLSTSFMDALSGLRHSHDFIYARADYFRSRVLIISLVFLLLMPFWTLFDLFVLHESARSAALWARLAMAVGLAVAVGLAYWGRFRIVPVYVATGLVFLAPIAFYGVVVTVAGSHGAPGLLGYDFIPYMLTTMVAIFPMTLVEGLVLGLVFFAAEAYAQWVAGGLFTGAGVQALWLLAAMLVITLTASYFHLNLLLRLYREATHDGLTGLLNRTAFISSLKQVILANRSERIMLMMLDLDHFKRLNDTHGHSVGDRVLQEFASIMRRSVRPTDFVARYGGEEFVIVLIGTSKERAMQVAEAIRVKTEATRLMDHQDRPVQFTVSIGVATLGPDESLSQAMRRADDRLYEAKTVSRNRVVGV